jgi:TetR/AcrR family fatty acid metabolism transcriptional regulator
MRVPVVRDIILGILNWEILNCIGSEEIEECLQDFEDIVSMVMPMIAKEIDSEKESFNKRINILRAAESVFAEKGYTEATIGEIAKAARVSEGTIYEYLDNKEHLLLSIPKFRFEEHIAALEDVFQIKDPLRKLRRLMRFHFYLYLKNPDFLKVFLLHIQLNKVFYSSEIYNIFGKYTQIIDNTLEEGKKQGCIRPEVSSRVFRNLFLGAFSHVTLRWVILGRERETDKMREIDEIVDLLSRAVTKTVSSSSLSDLPHHTQ